MELEPIEQLRRLLHERRQVAEKISSVESTLAYIRNNLSTVLAREYLHRAGAAIDLREDLMKEEQSYERLLQALHDFQAQIEERVRPVAEQVVQAEVARLRELSERHQMALKDCLDQIDQNILRCRVHMDEYQQRSSDLAAVNERLAKLGAEPVSVPEDFPVRNLGDVIRLRVDGLRTEGKI
jgi:hypothetical protein